MQACTLGKLVNLRTQSQVLISCAVVVLGPSIVLAQTLEPTKAMGIYQTIDQWVRDLEVQDEPIDADQEELSAVSVTLRLEGQVIARGQVISKDPNPLVVSQAARAAIAQARSWVRDQTENEPAQKVWDSVSSRITLSVELADTIVPMTPSDLASPGLGLSPGIHGLVMYLGEKSEIVTPDEMITLGLTYDRAAGSMATQLSGEGANALLSIGELSGRGFTFARCEPTWIGQSKLASGGAFLDRGGRVIQESSMGVRSVREMGERVARYLIAQKWPGSERYGMAGTRDVISGRASPEVAPVYEQALVATALLRFGASSESTLHTEATQHAIQMLKDLGAVEVGEPKPWDMNVDGGIGAAACMIALSYMDQIQIRNDKDLVLLSSQCQKTLESLYSPIDGYARTVPAPAWGLVAWGLSRSGSEPIAESAIRAAFRDTPVGQLAGQMPFLGWAELDLAQGKDTVPAEKVFNQMRALMWEHQLSRADLDWRDRDFLGAVVFTTGSSILPTSGNLRPIAFACSMLGDPRITQGTIADGSITSEITKTVSALRFVDQLMMSDDSAFLSRSPELCVGGVRSSLWKWEVNPASSAIALLAALEFYESIKSISVRASEITP
ncbi:MAG: hypothetical protein AB8C13_06405 [Phycisphaerales bacterium]